MGGTRRSGYERFLSGEDYTYTIKSMLEINFEVQISQGSASHYTMLACLQVWVCLAFCFASLVYLLCIALHCFFYVTYLSCLNSFPLRSVALLCFVHIASPDSFALFCLGLRCFSLRQFALFYLLWVTYHSVIRGT